jgi:hypothetical protein
VLPFAEDLDAEKAIHVQAPNDVVFLCGGKTSPIDDKVPLSLRDAFLKILINPVLANRELIQAEDITSDADFFSKYNNLLDFETDLAEIVELIVLFCESEGSFAELGSFVMIREIALRLFVVVREKHWYEDSFIRHGPLKYLVKKYGRECIYVINESEVGMNGEYVGSVKIDVLKTLLSEPLEKRLQKPRVPSTFDENSSGHKIKLVVGLVQEYGALTVEEIFELLQFLKIVSVTEQSLARYILCADAVGWLKLVSKGSGDYIVAVTTKVDAATIYRKQTTTEKNKARRRLIIRDHWKKTDKDRFSAITEVIGGGEL